MNTEPMPADDLDIPEALLVKNRKPLTPVQQKKVETVMAAASKAPAKSKPTAHKPAKAKSKPEVKRRADGLVENSAGAKLVDFVCRKQGATNAELCKMTGWKQCLPFLKKSCDQAGVKLTVTKEPGELARYHGTREASKK
jgi:hypothetical protein